jgi:hypothetical protein
MRAKPEILIRSSMFNEVFLTVHLTERYMKTTVRDELDITFFPWKEHLSERLATSHK